MEEAKHHFFRHNATEVRQLLRQHGIAGTQSEAVHRCGYRSSEHALGLPFQRRRISDKVGNTRNNWAELIEPVSDGTPKREKTTKSSKRKKEPPSKGLFD